MKAGILLGIVLALLGTDALARHFDLDRTTAALVLGAGALAAMAGILGIAMAVGTKQQRERVLRGVIQALRDEFQC